MKLKTAVTCIAGMATILVLGSLAFAGIEPVPWHTIISNRTNQLDPASTFYNRNLSGMVLTVRVPCVPGSDKICDGGTTPVDTPIKDGTGGDLTIAPGQTLAISMGPPTLGGQIVSWSFKAEVPLASANSLVFGFATKMGVEPSPFAPPILTASYLTDDMPILGFASPATVLGTVQIVTDEMFYTACPSLPEAPAPPWKNHGQYVRCIAQRAEELVSTGQLAQEQADAAVSAAAQSETGKK